MTKHNEERKDKGKDRTEKEQRSAIRRKKGLHKKKNGDNGLNPTTAVCSTEC